MTKTGKKKFEKKEDFKKDNIVVQKAMTLSILVSVKFCIAEHSMAIANLNKNEDFVTNAPPASKYIPRRSKISINLNPTFQTFFMK